MLHSLVPLALVVAPIVPVHVAIALPLVHVVASFITITGLPLEDAKTVLHVIPEIAIILVAVWSVIFLPPPRSVFKTIGEGANISCSIVPLVCAKAMRLTILVVSRVRVTIVIAVGTLAVL